MASSLSDVDIAVYLDEKLTRHQRFDLRLFLINRVCSLLGFKKIDLVILNDAPLILQYSILKDGVILYSRDELKRINIEVKIMSKYFDPEIGTPFIGLSILRAPGYPTEDGLAKLLGSLLTSLQLGLRFLAVLYFSEELTYLLAKKRLP